MTTPKLPAAIHPGWRILSSCVVGGVFGLIVYAANSSTATTKNPAPPVAQTVLLCLGMGGVGGLTYYLMGKLATTDDVQINPMHVPGYAPGQPLQMEIQLSQETKSFLNSQMLRSALPSAGVINNQTLDAEAQAVTNQPQPVYSQPEEVVKLPAHQAHQTQQFEEEPELKLPDASPPISNGNRSSDYTEWDNK